MSHLCLFRVGTQAVQQQTRLSDLCSSGRINRCTGFGVERGIASTAGTKYPNYIQDQIQVKKPVAVAKHPFTVFHQRSASARFFISAAFAVSPMAVYTRDMASRMRMSSV